MALRIELPLPPSEWNPNTNTNRFAKRKATHEAHDMVKVALNEARWDGYKHQYSIVTISFTVTTKGVRDKGNLI